MLGDLSSSVTQISDDALDRLFEGTSEKLPSADDLKFGKQSSAIGDVPELKEEEIIDIETEKKEPEEGKEGEEEKQEIAEEKQEEEKSVPSDVLKTSVDFLIEKGIFKDFEGRETLEVDDQTFAELLEAQISAIVEEKYTAQKEAIGEYGKAIIEYIEKNGDPDKIIDLFKEQQAVQEFEIKDEDSQEAIITQYYKDVLEWTPGQIKRHLNTLKSEENALEEEANDIKGKYEQHYKKQLSHLQAEQEAAAAAAEQAQKQYEANLKSAIKDYTTDDSLRKKIESALFKQKTVEINGQTAKVNDFYLKFAQLQQDPKQYIEFVEYVMEKEAYLKRQANKTKDEVNKKNWQFVKGGSAVSKTTGSSHTDAGKDDKSTRLDFSFVKGRK